jgi:hypothetical protein
MVLKKKGAVGKKAAVGGAAKMKRRPVNKPASPDRCRQPVRKSPQPRVWRRVAKLAADGLAALDAGNVAEVRGYLEAIRAVGLCAEQS